jgi:ABC-2 type transport system permease protein
MKTLLRTEWLKMRKYIPFWLMIAIIAISFPGINYMFNGEYKEIMAKKDMSGQVLQMLLGNPFAFPEAWHTVAFFSSIFIFIPAILVIMFITNEYSFKTYRQNIIDGWSRNQFMWSKFIDVLIISLLLTIIYTIVCLVIGNTMTEGIVKNKWEQSYYIGYFALLSFSQLSFAFLVAFLIRKAFISLGVFMFYFLMLDNYGSYMSRKHELGFGKFLPLEISDRMIPVPAFIGRFDEAKYKASLAEVNEHVIYTFILTALIWGFCFYYNKRRDL